MLGVGVASTTRLVVFVVVTASELLAVSFTVYVPEVLIVNTGLVRVEVCTMEPLLFLISQL
jgi:hypothetical protein